MQQTLAQQSVPNSSGTEVPKLKAPANACDCHMHIYDNRFPLLSGSSVPDATASDYRLLQKRIGTTRTVVVLPRTYATDNRCALEAISQLGGLSSARGVGVVHPDVTDAELKRLHDGGIRGIRFTITALGAPVTTIDMIEPLSKRVNELGWHVQIHMSADMLIANSDLWQRLPSPIVFDHMGRIPAELGTAHPAFNLIRRCLDEGRTWVKLSGAYLNTKVAPPTYADVTRLAQAYVNAAPERLVWGSDWPHPTEEHHKPDDVVLFDLLLEWAPDEATRNKILVDNPAKLYGFPKTAFDPLQPNQEKP